MTTNPLRGPLCAGCPYPMPPCHDPQGPWTCDRIKAAMSGVDARRAVGPPDLAEKVTASRPRRPRP